MVSFSKELVSARMVLLGVAQALAGCLIGFIPPTAVVHYRSLITCHIELVMNGILQAVLGFAVPRMLLGPTGLATFEVLTLLGTWLNGLAFVPAAFTGVSSPLMVTTQQSHPPKEISDRGATHYMLLACGVTMVGSLGIALYGLAKGYNLLGSSKAH